MRSMLVSLLALAATAASPAAAQTGSAFTYQGRVTLDGVLLDGTATIQLSLWRDAFSGNIADRIGNVQTLNNVQIRDGVFSVVANSLSEFGTNPFNGEARWLQVVVNGQTISPRQPILSTPYASGLSGGGGAQNNSSGTTTFSFTNLNTNTTSASANTLAVRRGTPSGISLTGYFPGALFVDTANINGIVATTSSSSAYSIFGFSTGTNGSGVAGRATGSSGLGVFGEATEAGGTAVFGLASGGGFAGRFSGKGLFTGNLGVGGAAPDTPLNINVGSNNLVQFRLDQFIPGVNINNTGGSAGILRLRNALEIWPSDNAARPGKLDVRNTSGNATVVLDGASGNISANNLPGIAYTQTFRDPRNPSTAIPVSTGFVTVDTLSVNVPAAGALLVTATVNISANAFISGSGEIPQGYFKLDDTSSGNAVQLTEVRVNSQGALVVGTIQIATISWVVPVSGPGVRSFKTTITNPGSQTFFYWTSSLNALYVPKTY